MRSAICAPGAGRCSSRSASLPKSSDSNRSSRAMGRPMAARRARTTASPIASAISSPAERRFSPKHGLTLGAGWMTAAASAPRRWLCPDRRRTHERRRAAGAPPPLPLRARPPELRRWAPPPLLRGRGPRVRTPRDGEGLSLLPAPASGKEPPVIPGPLADGSRQDSEAHKFASEGEEIRKCVTHLPTLPRLETLT
jgi:hypothetical protein